MLNVFEDENKDKDKDTRTISIDNVLVFTGNSEHIQYNMQLSNQLCYNYEHVFGCWLESVKSVMRYIQDPQRFDEPLFNPS